VRADIGARFHGIEEPLAGFIVTGMEIQVLPPPGISGSFPGKNIQQRSIEDIHCLKPVTHFRQCMEWVNKYVIQKRLKISNA
jgi:hypothetical protein